jgi:hypothetical protein
MSASRTNVSMKKSNPAYFYSRVVVVFILLALLLIFIIIYFSVLSVKILVTPRNEQKKIEQFISVVETDKKDIQNDELEGVFFDKRVTGSLSGTTSGKAKLPPTNDFQVILKNTSATDQTLVKTTRLLSENNVLLRMSESATVSKKGEKLVPVYIDDTSLSYFEKGNILAVGTKFRIPGLSLARQEDVYGEASREISAIGDEVTVLSEDDVVKLREMLVEQLKEQTIEALDRSSDSMILSGSEINSSEANQKIGNVSEDFTLTLDLRVFGVMLSRRKVMDMGESLLKKSMDSSEELISVSEDSLSLSLEKFDVKNSTASVKLSLSGESSIRLESNLLDKKTLIGMNKSELVQYFDGIDELSRVEIRFFPFWVRRVPKQLDHIQIEIVR